MVRRNKQKIRRKKKRPPKKYPRFHLLLDEGLHPTKKFPLLNNEHDLWHLSDIKKPPRKDLQIYKYAVTNKMNLIVFNNKHFKIFANKKDKIGIFLVSQTLPVDQIDKKISAYLKCCKEKSLYGKTIPITGEIGKD